METSYIEHFMSAEFFYAMGFVMLIILADVGIRWLGDWLHPNRIGADKERRPASVWDPLKSSSRGVAPRRSR
jgi:hypothetical protein